MEYIFFYSVPNTQYLEIIINKEEIDVIFHKIASVYPTFKYQIGG